MIYCLAHVRVMLKFQAKPISFIFMSCKLIAFIKLET